MGWIIAKKRRAPCGGAREEKGEFEWETLIAHIGHSDHYFSLGNKKPRRSGALVSARDCALLGSNGRNVCRLKALWTLDYVESNSLSLRKRPETLYLDFTEVDEEILPLRLLNESVALFGTKPLDSPLSQPYNLHVLGATLFGPPHSKARGPGSSGHAAPQ
jgi:hypothetical protein